MWCAAGAHCAPVCSRRALRTCALRGSGLPHLPICDSLPVKEHHHSCLKADCGVGMLVVRTHKTDMHTCTCALTQDKGTRPWDQVAGVRKGFTVPQTWWQLEHTPPEYYQSTVLSEEEHRHRISGLGVRR